jgi:hypothetical protein
MVRLVAHHERSVAFVTLTVRPCGKLARPVQGRIPGLAGAHVIVDALTPSPVWLMQEAHSAPAAPVSAIVGWRARRRASQ